MEAVEQYSNVLLFVIRLIIIFRTLNVLERNEVLGLTASKPCAIFHNLERKAIVRVMSGTGSIFNITNTLSSVIPGDQM